MTLRTARAGVTLVEIIVAMTLTLAVFAITLPFVRVQTRALGENASRVDAEQIARYAQRVIDRDLRLAVSDPGQPMLVYAGTMAIAFNANLLARDTTDPNALEIDASADSAITEAWRLADATEIPVAGLTYPPADYLDASGSASRNETVMYFLHPDTISGRSDVYVLYRRVNAEDSVQIVRGIHVPTDSAFFTYQTMVAGALTPIAAGSLPLAWDTTAIDDIRAVQLRSGGFFRNRQKNEDVIRTVYWNVVLGNRAVATIDCGAAPDDPSGVAQSKQNVAAGYYLRVTWDASGDDGDGAEDVTHYIVSTRLNVSPIVWTPIATIPAREAASYRYDHYLPQLIGSVKYGVHAVDCGGTASATAQHASALTLP